jgi:hypothetical protein
MTRCGYQIAEYLRLVLRFSKTQRQRVAHGKHTLYPPILNNGQVTDVVYCHQLLRAPHAVIEAASHNPRRHNIPSPYVLYFGPVGASEGPHEVPFSDHADHLSAAQFANRHRTDLVRKHPPCDGVQRVVWQARHKALT